MKRIVITGMGAFTPIGNDPCTFWENMLAGKSGAGPLTLFDAGDMPYNIACEVKEFDARNYMDRKVIRRTARATQLGVASTKQALADAGIEISKENRDEVGVMMATGGGGIIEIEHATEKLVDKSWKTVGPFVVPSAMANATSCVVSMAVGARGPVMTSAAACASGNYSIVEAYHFLQRGEADVMIAGGTESAISMLTFAAFGNMGPLSKDTHIPQQACRPFSIDRNGFVSGEGAVTMILETEEHAKARGAKIYAEVLGGALTGDAYHLTAPDPSAEGASRAIRKALRYSNLAPADVDVILAHGTGTELNDEVEALAIRQVFWSADTQNHQHQEHGGPRAGSRRRRIRPWPQSCPSARTSSRRRSTILKTRSWALMSSAISLWPIRCSARSSMRSALADRTSWPFSASTTAD